MSDVRSDPSGRMADVAPSEPRRTFSSLWLPAAAGTAGSALLAVASNLPASPYGPHSAGLWPLAARGTAPAWEGPALPWWAKVANSGPGVPPGHLLPTAAAVAGVALLWVAWIRLWREARAQQRPSARGLWWTIGMWIAPMLLAAPFASQDVWIYGAQGKMALSGLGASKPVALLGHSVWLSGVDPKWATRPSIYGPGSLDLSALFVKISFGRPWVAAECWRFILIAGLLLCVWGVRRIVTVRGGSPTQAVVAGVFNPGVLLVLVASIHNDALMVGLVVAGVAMAVSGRPWLGLVLCALAATVKAPGALALLAIAWWGWKKGWAGRLTGLLAGGCVALTALVATGLAVGGGFEWVKSASLALLTSSFSIGGGLLGITSGGFADTLQLVGVVLAAVLVIKPRQLDKWTGGLALSFVVLAVFAVNPQPWYLPWAVVLLSCSGIEHRLVRAGVVVLAAMMAWSEMPFGTLVWFLGLVVLTWVGFSLEREWRVPWGLVAMRSDGRLRVVADDRG
jgi:alpha-1,6-mannosyltransferase